MKIVDRKTFLTLPAGTVYAKCAPWVFEGLCIKGDSLTDDWFYATLGADAIQAHDGGEWADRLEQSKNTGKSLAMDFDIESRDGCFEAEQLFAVFEGKDVADLLQRLTRCIPPRA